MSWDVSGLLAKVREDMRRDPSLRYGQALYNAAYRMNPAVAHLAGDDADPFYDDRKVDAFLAKLTAAPASAKDGE